jgi:ABC-type sugar transport system permease subunit
MGSATAMSYILAIFLIIISAINFLALREREKK